MVINTAPQLSPSHLALTEETREFPMEEGNSEPVGPRTPILPPLSSLSPGIQFLEAPNTPTHHPTGHRGYKPKGRGGAKATIAATVLQGDLQVEHQDIPSTSTALTPVPLTSFEAQRSTHVPGPTSSSDAYELQATRFESIVYVRSTMKDALVSPTKFPAQPFGDVSSDTSCNTSPVIIFV